LLPLYRPAQPIAADLVAALLEQAKLLQQRLQLAL